MIPEAKQPAVTRALQTAFGVAEYEAIQPLTGGLSTALAFKIVVKSKPYLLKILRTEIISDPAKEFACMQTAGEAGIAPRVWYANVEERVLITDFVEAQPFPQDMALRLAAILRTLHGLPGFPKMMADRNYLDVMDGLAQRVQALKILPESATEEVFRHYAEIVKVYPHSESELVASHNDVKPQNMRFDGQRLWLVDWESAFLNDPYVDLAIVANFFVKDEAQEEEFLHAYFGEPLADWESGFLNDRHVDLAIVPNFFVKDEAAEEGFPKAHFDELAGEAVGEAVGEPLGEYRRARFFLMRQILSVFYLSLLLLEASRAGQTINADMPTTDFRIYHEGLVADQIDMLKPEAKVEYGLIHLREALRNMRSARFEEALAQVGAGA